MISQFQCIFFIVSIRVMGLLSSFLLSERKQNSSQDLIVNYTFLNIYEFCKKVQHRLTYISYYKWLLVEFTMEIQTLKHSGSSLFTYCLAYILLETAHFLCSNSFPQPIPQLHNYHQWESTATQNPHIPHMWSIDPGLYRKKRPFPTWRISS